jgi:glycosyltransferase involved in cell wall biosynthesis
MPEYSGSGFRAHNLYKRLCVKQSDINLTVLSGSVTENESAVYDYDGVSVHRIAGKIYPDLSSNALLRKYQIARNFYAEYKLTTNFLRNSQKFNLIHIFGQDYVSATVLNYAKQQNIPTLIELCNEMDNPHHYIPFPFSLAITGKPPLDYKFICISERLKKVCLKNGVPEKNIWCRPNPINEKLFKPVTEDIKIKLRSSLTKFSADDKLLVYVAKYIPRKNHIFLIDVIKNLPEQYKLFISGPVAEEGPLKKEGDTVLEDIKLSIETNKLSDRVQFEHGFCENIEKYYQMADFYLFPTKEEGLGTPMLEAVACAVPVIANLIPGITDSWIRNGENGFTLQLDSAKFAEKIIESESITADKMAEESKKIIKTAGTESIDKVYADLINNYTKAII